MATKKKNPAEMQTNPAPETNAPAPAENEAAEPEQVKQDTPSPEPETAQENPPSEEAPEPEQVEPTERTCPFDTTIAVSLAVLRKSIGPGTEDMLKPVATLKQGTKVTVTAINGEYAQLRNGLWISAENLA